MARTARKQSDLGYLHLIVRGIGRQLLFEEYPDYQYYLSHLEKYSKETNVTICAYCLMENHVHLLVFDKDNNTPVLMKKLGVSYSAYYNLKYERTGHLFQDRYLSEPINDEDYLITVFRYILNNPQKAGISQASAYEWSSYRFYGRTDSFVDTSMFIDMIGNMAEYSKYIAAKNEDVCMEINLRPKMSDSKARTVIQKLLNAESGTILQSYDSSKRNAALRSLKENGLTVRQIERLTGINRGIIQKA